MDNGSGVFTQLVLIALILSREQFNAMWNECFGSKGLLYLSDLVNYQVHTCLVAFYKIRSITRSWVTRLSPLSSPEYYAIITWVFLTLPEYVGIGYGGPWFGGPTLPLRYQDDSSRGSRQPDMVKTVTLCWNPTTFFFALSRWQRAN